MWNYVYMKDSSMSSIYYPVMVYIDKNDNVQQVTTGYQELSVIQNYLEYYCGIQNEDSVFTVKYRPNGGDGDEIVKTYNMKSTAEVLNNPYNNTGYGILNLMVRVIFIQLVLRYPILKQILYYMHSGRSLSSLRM